VSLNSLASDYSSTISSKHKLFSPLQKWINVFPVLIGKMFTPFTNSISNARQYQWNIHVPHATVHPGKS